MNNNDMNIELLKALRGVWIIEIETLEKRIKCEKEYVENTQILIGKKTAFEQCLSDLIAIIGE